MRQSDARSPVLRPGIELGVERVRAVARERDLIPRIPLIAVVGTNGKGSCCRWLETLALSVGKRSGVFVSPWLDQPGEQIRLSGTSLSAAAFAAAEQTLSGNIASGQVTEFELHALLAMEQALAHESDVLFFEAGMGGEGDAVNAWDADAAIVTSIGLDHEAWIGPSKDEIARNKAGIARPGRPVWVAEPNPPESLWRRLRTIGADVRRLGTDFGFERQTNGLRLWAAGAEKVHAWAGLPMPICRQDACLSVLAASAAAFVNLFPDIALTDRDVLSAIQAPTLPGRLERIDAQVPVLLDVAHNREAVVVLASQIDDLPCPLRAVFAGLRDKPVSAMYEHMRPHVDHWYPAAASPPRGLTREEMEWLGRPVHADVEIALETALADARGRGSVLVFGCFEAVRRARRVLLDSEFRHV